MDQDMKGIGLKINNTDMGLNFGQIEQNTKENMKMVKNMETEHLNGQMDLFINDSVVRIM